MKKQFTQEQHLGDQITQGRSRHRGHLSRTRYKPMALFTTGGANMPI